MVTTGAIVLLPNGCGSGARTPPGMPEPRRGIQLQVLTKENNEWLIASFQNTNSIPEFPFPTGPPPGGPTKQ